MLQLTLADDCTCRCCTSKNCDPQPVADHYVWYCSHLTCSADKCIGWYQDKCPPQDAPGASQAVCKARSGTERLFPSVFIFTGITSIILLIKNQL